MRLTRRDALDAALVLALTALALYGFRTTFSGERYLVVGVVACVVGVGVVTLTTALRAPVWVIPLAVAAAYYAFGSALVLGRVWAAPDLTSVLVDGWVRLLTTLPPVATSGRLLAIPFVLGLVAGALGAALAQRSRSRLGPALGPVLCLGAVLALGTNHPAARWAQGLAFAVLVLASAALRPRRAGRGAARDPRRAGAGGRTRGDAARSRAARSAGLPQRVLVGTVVLGLAAGGATWLGPRLPFGGGHRVVARDYVTPPFDLADYPSPLVGFRKYTKDARLLYDQTLFTVRGLPAQQVVRLATLDGYDGTVWGATDGFLRVGSSVDPGVGGRDVTLHVRIGEAYASATDIDAWVPTAGLLRSVAFRDGSHAETFRYDLATGSGVVADRLAPGDTYTVRAVLPAGGDTLPKDASPYGTPTLDPTVTAFVGSRAAQWSASADSVVGQANAVAKYLRDKGAYSDGGPGEGQYRPGHSTGRLTAFLNAAQLVGDDEQYAAVFALMCNYLGLPARVVLVAAPEADGTVKGKDVQGAVEVHVRTGSAVRWVLLRRDVFMPDLDKKPNKQPPITQQDRNAAVVPPPNPVRPPSTLQQPDRPDQNTQQLPKPRRPHPALSGASYVLVYYVGGPVLGVVLLALLVVGVKWRRRVLRRSRGSLPDRFDAGWREYVDTARDLGAAVPAGTRREQAAGLSARPAGDRALALAAAADAGVFAAGTPTPEQTSAFWREVDAARVALARGAGRLGRLRGALNVRSLRPPARTS